MITSQIKSGDLGKMQSNQCPIILAVDDQEDNLFLLSCSLEQFNCEVVGVTTGRAALEFVATCQPALILLDLVMPDLQGIELLRLLRQQFNCTMPIIAVTGMPAFENRELFIAAGFSDYLSKPYMIEDLQAMVQRWGIPLHAMTA